jgi:hypothetical protein
MATYKGKYYKLNLVKAQRDYTCAVSGVSIPRGDHYLCIEIEDSCQRVGRHQLMYTPTETLRISKRVLAANTIEEILDATNRFQTDSERLVELKAENAELTAKLALQRKINEALKAIIRMTPDKDE